MTKMTVHPTANELSLVHGNTDEPLWEKTLADLVNEQAEKFGGKTAVRVPWQNVELTYSDLAKRSLAVARGLLAHGLMSGDYIGIFAGNRYEYIEAFLGATCIGCPVVVLNNTYTAQELARSLMQTSCKLLFIANHIKGRSLLEHMRSITQNASHVKMVTFGPTPPDIRNSQIQSYDVFASVNPSLPELENIHKASARVKPTDVLNLQFTSGTTGTPKAAMLTHRNILNNAHLVGARLGLTPSSTICCPPPLFHCFGLVMGFLAALAHGAAIVFPADAFDAGATVAAVARERCDVLLGVPTMLLAVLEESALRRTKNATTTTTTTMVRTVLAAGSLVAAPLMERLRREMGVRDVLVAYGMTETSPVSFMTARRGDRGSVEAEEEEGKRGGGGLGMVMPHTSAKVVDGKGRVVPRGVRGELCTSGYLLMKGYLGNENATREVMERDESGRVWMRTGDECVIDESGACSITGRIKDIIIRGGENIFPAEIEERLAAHPLVAEACVVGVKDEKYGEVVGCFLRAVGGGKRPDDANLQSWVKEALGRHKSPQWVFWIGDSGVGPDYPKTGSGKHQKHILRALANKLVGANSFKARL
ncbi:Acyl-CoA synthetase family member 2 [Lasiodiplodia theobromae]|uniref:Acyl-CoA synthetase family member 2 n=1 Tax=Lasiodiplodia theobromae TaxID=45133 RepID=A0A5N5DAG1_9PEZI|nr:Acyl-CoA synthetase family member 2 [Lasiodiplodia theobromae]